MKKLSDCHVLVTPNSYGRNDPSLITDLEEQVGTVTINESGSAYSSEKLQELLPDVDGYIAGLDEIDAAALRSSERLRVIARYGVGVDNVDLDVARKRGITVTNTPEANSKSVAELAVTLMLLLARPVMSASERVRNGGWPRGSGRSLENKTVGIIGIGAIGKEVVRRLEGFDCNLLGFDVRPDQEFIDRHDIEMMDQDSLLQQSDFVTLHAPLLPETRHLVDREFLEQMKDEAYLINTARGELVDEEALYEALSSDHLAGAALDAFLNEPPEQENQLVQRPDVIPTPHMGAHTDRATKSMGRMALRDCLAVLRDEEPEHLVV